MESTSVVSTQSSLPSDLLKILSLNFKFEFQGREGSQGGREVRE